VTDVGPVPPTDDDVIRAIRSVILAAERLRHNQAAIQDVGESELLALGHLYYDGELTPGELSDRLGLSSGTMTALVDRLESAGHAARSPNPDDRRSQLVRISETGTAIIGSLHAEFAQSLHGTLVEMSTPTRRALVGALAALAADIDAHSATLVDTPEQESQADWSHGRWR
jgi:DNA-binding MarR family transcriptional regulator